MITDKRIIEMIDEYTEEPNSNDREWTEAMFYIRQLLINNINNRNINQ